MKGSKRRIKRKLNLKRLILFLLIIAAVVFINIYSGKVNLEHLTDTTTYSITHIDKNSDYTGIGQETVEGKDGYFTTFTTSENYKKTYIEYKQNGNASWSNKSYWGNTMAENGCRNYYYVYYS